MVESSTQINDLKSQVLLKAGIGFITPGDCKRISIEISKSVNKQVSETTIKRFFGFAVLNHNFSQFTLSAISAYAESLESCDCARIETKPLSALQSNWEQVSSRAAKITDNTLKEIQNRSGLPYEMTISRKFAAHDFEEFIHSKYTFMSFMSQPGYGRTILLSHLVNDYFRKENAIYQDSTVLFLTAANLLKADKIANVEEHIKSVLHIPQDKDLFQYCQQHQSGKKFILIIDGFCELVLKKEMKNQLFDSILNFICALDQTGSIKVILSMRSTTWIRYYERMRHSSYLKESWFKGNYYNPNDVSNVPPLTEQELQQIICKTGVMDFNAINPKLKAQLKFPFHIHLYFQLKEEDPFINFSTNITFYELVSRFIQEKIYRSNYYTEKILFIKRFVQMTDYGKLDNFVAKDQLIGELSAFKNAYMELLSDGILMEERHNNDVHPKEYVRFLHAHVFEYFLFIEILEEFKLAIDLKFMEYIENEYSGNNKRFILLQWTVRYLIKISDYASLSCIFKLKLINYERNYLVLFIAENLQYKYNLSPSRGVPSETKKLHDTIAAELKNFDFIDSSYKQGIIVLAEICEKDHNWLKYQTILAILDTLSGDLPAIKNRVQLLNEHQELCSSYPYNPLSFLSYFLKKLTGAAFENDNLDQMLADFIQSAHTETPEKKIPDTQTCIFYVFLLGINMVNKDEEGRFKLIQAIYKKHPRLFYSRSPFSTYMLLLLGINRIRLKDLATAKKICSFLNRIHHENERYTLTKYCESLLIMLNADLCSQTKAYETAIDYAERGIEIFKRNDLSLNCVKAYDIIIDCYQNKNDMAKVNEYKYEKLCLINEKIKKQPE
ncbi:NACHT domain-containing protein [Pedobacter metabolipauper]|uniref:NACHT domain-containing protein n=1 Tax=Pedobacter metabolipauper TaxID=425513 RepID=A0A4R6T286_9SPHI|nr:hypothetical protein [Pedobacter metabolipauper]TDQ11441.1 hypothetical protein ATK78_0563 [Pedobacter metabolipauper]